MLNILDFTLSELEAWMKDNNEEKFRAKQVFDWIYKGIEEFKEMKNLPSNTIEKLYKCFYLGIPKIVRKLKSNDNSTCKFLYKYRDGNVIESVVMKYKYGNSICVSTQVGCKMGCKFCASTLGGVVRNLTSGEMLGQVLAAQKEINSKISNVVLMGSGEPLDNYDNVIKFIKMLNSKYGLNISQRHITLSTCGIVPNIRKLSTEKLNITLAISLHAPNDILRKKIMPIANKYSIHQIIGACNEYYSMCGRRITFEYALIKNFNDSTKDAIELSNILRGLVCHVNLIPINNVAEKSFERSSKTNINKFKSVLLKNDIQVTVRRQMGNDINAACGQLRRNYITANV